MRTVYVVIKDGCVAEAYANHFTDLVVLDLDTQDEQMLAKINKEIKKIQENNDCIEIY